jgi:UDP-glucose 4-epimerase
LTPSFDLLSGKSVLVTGARGFIGSNLRMLLSKAGAQVTATSRSPCEEPGATWRTADLTTPHSAERLVAEVEPDFIFHLSGYVTAARGLEHVGPALQANLLDAVNLMTAASKRPGCRVVLANSLEEPSEEEYNAPPTSPYAAAKYAGTCYARMYHALYDLPVAITRISMGYGPRQSDLKKLVPYLCLSALKGEQPSLSSGARTCDWVFGEDIAEGMVASILSDKAMGQVIDIASGEMASVRFVAETIVELTPGAPEPLFGALQDRSLERLRPADIEGAFERTGWRAKVDLNEGLRRSVDYYRQLIAEGKA